MKLVPFSLITFALVSSAQAAPPAVPFADGYPVTDSRRIYDLSEVKRGDRGVGYTVFAGAEVKPFDVEVLGVMEGLVGPDQDVILARLSGPEIEFTGVISGMSGSPVFIDGRLLGAVAYRFGQFTREPIAGITPIRNMLAVYGPQVGPADRPAAGTSDPRLSLAGLARDGFRWRATDLPPWPVPRRPDRGDLRPIDTPLTVSGLEPSHLQGLRDHLRPAGLTVIAGGGSASLAAAHRGRGARKVRPNRADHAGAVPAAPIAPGAPVAIVLARGAVNVSALCTVTMVERGRVYGCGHPFLGFGHTQFPMATAAVLNTVASEAGSWKQSAPAREVGTIDHDRLTAVAGALGKAAPMVPVRVVVRRRDQTPDKAVVTDVEIVDSPVWLPIMLSTVVGSAIERRLGAEPGGTLALRARISVGNRILNLNDTFSAPAPARLGRAASGDVAAAAGILLDNELERASIRSIEVQATVSPEVSYADVVRVTPDKTWVEPGERLGVTVELKPYRRPVRRARLQVPIPTTAAGSLKIMVGGSIELDRRDANARGGRVPTDLDDLIDMLGDRRPARALFARVYLPAPGFRIESTVLAALPPSAQATLLSQAGANSAGLQESMGPEVRRADPDVVLGGAELTVEVRR